MKNRIPKIIHYCWFGSQEKPKNIKKIMNTWNVLKGYRFIEWNDRNIDLDLNKFLQTVSSKKKWAFVSDYIRLKALYMNMEEFI